MGQMVMYDSWMANQRQRDITLFDLDDVDIAFDRIAQLKFSQTQILSGTFMIMHTLV